MYTTTKQCLNALRSGRINVTGIDCIVLTYNGEDVTFYNGVQAVVSPDWDFDTDHPVHVAEAFIEDYDLYISLEDADPADSDGIFTGKMKDLRKVMSERVFENWSFAGNMDKMMKDDPIIDGIRVFSDNLIYVY